MEMILIMILIIRITFSTDVVYMNFFGFDFEIMVIMKIHRTKTLLKTMAKKLEGKVTKRINHEKANNYEAKTKGIIK